MSKHGHKLVIVFNGARFEVYERYLGCPSYRNKNGQIERPLSGQKGTSLEMTHHQSSSIPLLNSSFFIALLAVLTLPGLKGKPLKDSLVAQAKEVKGQIWKRSRGLWEIEGPSNGQRVTSLETTIHQSSSIPLPSSNFIALLAVFTLPYIKGTPLKDSMVAQAKEIKSEVQQGS